jgi:carbon-monoxide dehydrogenase medium subunit
MLLPRFSYHRPDTLGEAVEVLAAQEGRAKVLAGGTDLLVNMKLGKLNPEHVVSLGQLAELSAVSKDDGKVRVGALCRAVDMANGDRGLVPPALAASAAVIGSPQVRARATVGGNLVTARPAGDMCVGLLALGASAVLSGSGGERRVALEDFFKGPGQTDIKPDEILTGVEMDAPAAGRGGGFLKLGLRRALEIALVSVGAQIQLDGDGKTIAQARVSLGAVGPTPLLASSAAGALIGAPASEETFEQAAQAAAGDAKPIDDHRGSAAYRRDMVAVLTRRALRAALAAARA